MEGSRLHVRDPAPGPSPPMTCTTCWLAATWPWLPLPALPPGVIIHIRTLKLEVLLGAGSSKGTGAKLAWGGGRSCSGLSDLAPGATGA